MIGWKLEGPHGRRREIAVAAVVLAAVTACCFWMLVLNPAGLLVGPQRDGGNDLTAFFWAAHSVPRLSVAWYAEYPLWNPYLGTGSPWYGNPQSACWYPPNWVLLLCDTGPALCWLMLAHQWWAGLGTFLVCRRWGFGVVSSLLGGSLFLAAPYYVAQIGEGHYAQICVLSWVPWAMLAYEEFRAQPSRGWPWVTLVLAVSALAGHFQEAYYLAVTLTVFAVLDAWQQWRRANRELAAQVLVHWFAVGALTAGIAVAEVLPSWTQVQQSLRSSGFAAEGPTQAGLGLANLWQLFNSAALGGPEAYQAAGFYWGSFCYFGLVTLALAVFGLLTQWRRYPVFRCFGLWLLALGFAFGMENAVYGLFQRLVPGMTLFRGPDRALFLCAFAVSVLAAAGAESVVAAIQGACQWGGPRVRRRLVTAGTVCLLLLLVSWVYENFSQQPASATEAHPAVAAGQASSGADATADDPFWERWNASLGRWQTWAWLAATLGLLGLATLGRKAACWSLAGLFALGMFELATHADRVLRIAPRAEVRQRSPVVEFLRGRAGYQRVIAEQSLLSDREAIENGIFKLQAYDPVPLLRYSFSMHALNGFRDPMSLSLGFDHLELSGLNPTIANLLGVRYAVVSPQAGSLPRSWRLVKRGHVPEEVTLRGRPTAEREYCIYENPTALPRCFVVGGTRILRDTDLAARTLTAVDSRNEVLVGQDLLGKGRRTDFRPAKILQYTPNEVVVDVALRRPGYLVLSDTWYPGWVAEDNGRPAPLVAANVTGRAVPLGPGQHRVVFRYGWSRYLGGLLISSLALALVVLQIRRSRLRPV